MDSTKIESFIAGTGNKFPPDKLILIRQQLECLDDSKLPIIQSVDYKDPTILLIFSLFFGYLGVDRFMLGETGLGVAKLLTCGGFGIWAFVDFFLIMGKTREYNYNRFMAAYGACPK